MTILLIRFRHHTFEFAPMTSIIGLYELLKMILRSRMVMDCLTRTQPRRGAQYRRFQT